MKDFLFEENRIDLSAYPKEMPISLSRETEGVKEVFKLFPLLDLRQADRNKVAEVMGNEVINNDVSDLLNYFGLEHNPECYDDEWSKLRNTIKEWITDPQTRKNFMVDKINGRDIGAIGSISDTTDLSVLRNLIMKPQKHVMCKHLIFAMLF